MDEILKTMLSKRGVAVETMETLEDPAGGRLLKIGEYLVHVTPKSRVSESDLATFMEEIGKQGAARGILIVENPPSAVVLNAIRKVADKVQLFHKKQLIIDISAHRKVPPHRILSAEERTAFLESYRASTKTLPDMDSQDAMAKWIGARPGDIVEILRGSEAPYYRLCIANTSLA